MKFEYYPDEIAAALADVAGELGNYGFVDSVTEAIYQLKAICENELNSDFYRDFYRLLEQFTARHGVTLPF